MTIQGLADTIDEAFVPPTSDGAKAKFEDKLRKASLIVFKSLEPSVQNKLGEANAKDIQNRLGIIKFLTKHYAHSNVNTVTKMFRNIPLLKQGPTETTLNLVDRVERYVEHSQRVVQRANFAFEDLLTLMALLQGATVEVQGQLATIMLDPDLTCDKIKERVIAAYDSCKTRKQVTFT